MQWKRELLQMINKRDYEGFRKAFTVEDLLAECPLGTYFHVCAESNHPELVSFLVDRGMDLNRRAGVWDATAMAYVANTGDLEMVKLLYGLGATFDVYGHPLVSPFIQAIEGGRIQVVKYFLDAGLDPHLAYRIDGGILCNAFYFAKQRHNQEIIDLLASYGCRDPIEGVDKPVWELPRELWTEVDSARELVVQYMEMRFGEVDELAMQELIPVVDDMSVAINIIRPNDDHPFLVLFTNGMSQRAMTVPKGQEAWRYAELVMHLPADWRHPRDADGDPQWLWPVHQLRKLAYYPHLSRSWLGLPATIVSSEPLEPLGPGTRQTSLLLVPDFANLSMPLVRDNESVTHFYTVVPLYPAERDYELQHGMSAFFKRFIAAKVPMTVDVNRPSFA